MKASQIQLESPFLGAGAGVYGISPKELDGSAELLDEGGVIDEESESPLLSPSDLT